jgi:hypothetical protein
MVRHRLVTALYVLPALPPLAVTLVVALIAGAEIAGSHPLTIAPPRNVAEAIAIGDAATAARLVEGGASLTEVAVIRPGFLGDRTVLATPIEIAVIRDQASLVDYLVSRGAVRPPHLQCLAADAGARTVQAHVGTDTTCHNGEALRAVLSRP